MATLSRAAAHVKSNVNHFLPEQVIRDAAEAVGHRWRDRKLGPVRTVLLLVLQLLSANASLAHARALGGFEFSVSALAQARDRLPLSLLQRVLDGLIAKVARAGAFRVVLIDAFNTLAPDTLELRRRYRRPRQQRSRRGCDYPQVRSLAVFDLASGLLLARHEFPADRHESPQLIHVLPLLRPGDVAVFDRGLVSYANLCLLRTAGVHVVARLARGFEAKRRSGSNRTRIRRLGKRDTLVCWKKPGQRPPGSPLSRSAWARLPDQIQLRQLTITARTGRSRRVMLITDLTDPLAHPASQLTEWYRRRWEVETDVRHLKRTMNLEFFRTRSVAGVRREMLIQAIAYNLVRLAMLESARLRDDGVDPGRVSFADALRWLISPDAGDDLCRLLINPLRTRTARPRRIKYRGKNYRLLTSKPPRQRRVA